MAPYLYLPLFPDFIKAAGSAVHTIVRQDILVGGIILGDVYSLISRRGACTRGQPIAHPRANAVSKSVGAANTFARVSHSISGSVPGDINPRRPRT